MLWSMGADDNHCNTAVRKITRRTMSSKGRRTVGFLMEPAVFVICGAENASKHSNTVQVLRTRASGTVGCRSCQQLARRWRWQCSVSLAPSCHLHENHISRRLGSCWPALEWRSLDSSKFRSCSDLSSCILRERAIIIWLNESLE
jgi:hypothetical protein